MADETVLSERLEALESRLAYQEQTVETLNETVTAQWRIIDRLNREVAALGERVENTALGPDQVDRRPPHY